MWKIIAGKELRETLFSPKFIVLFVLMTGLILLSMVNGYAVYRGELDYYQEQQAKAREDLATTDTTAIEADYAIYREPSPLMLFDIGVHGVIGRSASVEAHVVGGVNRSGSTYRAVDSRGSIEDDLYSKNPVLALFGDLNLAFVATTILSLFALILSYGAICGERENGTLTQVLTHSVRRSSVFLGKLLSGFITIAMLFIIPFLIGLAALLVLYDISFTGAQWLRIAMIGGAILLYGWLFYIVGLTAGALVRRSFVSFTICLLLWVTVTTLIPRIAIQAAQAVSPPMSREEVAMRSLTHYFQINNQFMNTYLDFIETHVITRETYNDKYKEFYGEYQDKVSADRREFEGQLWREYGRRREALARTTAFFARASPYPCLLFTINDLTGTDHELLKRMEDAAQKYQSAFQQYGTAMIKRNAAEFERRQKTENLNFSTDADGYVRIKFNRDGSVENPLLDLGVVPGFSVPALSEAAVVTDATTNTGLIVLYGALCLLIGYVAFLRYDVRSS